VEHAQKGCLRQPISKEGKDKRTLRDHNRSFLRQQPRAAINNKHAQRLTNKSNESRLKKAYHCPRLKGFFDKENFCVNIAFGPCRAKSSTSSLCSVTFAVISLLKAKMP